MFGLSDLAAILIAAVAVVGAVIVALVALGRRGRRVHITVDVGNGDDDDVDELEADR